jgi:hypothetical protein
MEIGRNKENRREMTTVGQIANWRAVAKSAIVQRFLPLPPTGGQIEKWPPVAASREKVKVLGFGPRCGPVGVQELNRRYGDNEVRYHLKFWPRNLILVGPASWPVLGHVARRAGCRNPLADMELQVWKAASWPKWGERGVPRPGEASLFRKNPVTNSRGWEDSW